MSEKLSEQLCMIAEALETTNSLRGRRIEHIAKKVAALEQQLAAEQAAHDQIATICFKVGADTTDGTSISAVLSLADIVIDFRQQLAAKDAEIARLRDIHNERIAQLTAHRVCCGTEHDPLNGKLHGFCVVCGVPWPCEYAGMPITLAETPEVPEVLGKCDYSHGYRSVPGFRLHAKKNDCINWRAETHAAPSANRPVMATRNAVTTIDAHDDKSEIWHVTDGDEQQKWHCYEVSPGRWMCDLMETAPAAPEVK